MTHNLNFVFRKSQRELFRSGELVRQWRTRYPKLFDEDDERVLRTEHQRQYNFYEWLAAVLTFEATGYLSLVAKYTAKNHPLKNAQLRKALPVAVANWVFENESGQPDLFVFSENYGDWFFCEVKGPGDRMRENQVEWRSGFETLLAQQNINPSNRYQVFTLADVDSLPFIPVDLPSASR